MNKISKKLLLDFDKNGDIAKNGQLIPKLLEKLNNLDFYKQKAPKSLAREWVEKFITPLLLSHYEAKDMLHTFCEHVAIQIGRLVK